MIETGVIVETYGDQARVAFTMKDACRTCNAGCLFASGENSRTMLQVHNPIHAQVGDRVRVKISPVSSVRAATVLFLFPLLAMILGYVVGQALTGSPRGGMAGTGLALLAAFLSIRFLDRLLVHRRGYEPIILGRVTQPQDTTTEP